MMARNCSDSSFAKHALKLGHKSHKNRVPFVHLKVNFRQKVEISSVDVPIESHVQTVE